MPIKTAIAIDCDDVIVGTAPHILSHYNDTYGTTIELSDFYSNDPEVWGVSDHTTAVQRVNDYLMSEEHHALQPFREAIDVITRLSDRYELHVVTGRHDMLAEATHHMLNRHFAGIFASVEFTNFFSEKPRSKATVCEEIGARYLIDDHLHHANVVAERGIDVLLFGEYPWNKTDHLPSNIRRVRDWQEIADLLLT